MKITGLKISLTIIMLMSASILLAQPGPPPDPDVPITGIEILLALGGALGIKRLMGSKKSKEL